ncbi:potassium channel, subfamily K, member 16 [Ciona intestinalis]
MKWLYIAILICLYFVYLLVGAGVFVALEFTREELECQRTITEIGEVAAKVNSNLSNTNGSNENLTGEDFRNLIQLIREAPQNGVQFDSNQTASCARNWDFHNAFFFAGTVVTTIGYGNISPQTFGGRVFCIFYAAIGIPLFAIMFAAIGEKIVETFFLYAFIHSFFQYRLEVHFCAKAFVFIVTAGTLLLFCCVIPAFVFVAVEKWDYNEAFYYSFITLTTIGFGDFVVGTDADLSYATIYNVGVYFWILFGLAYMATVISIASGYMHDTAKPKKHDSNTSAKPTEDGVDGEFHATDDEVTPNKYIHEKELPLDGDSTSNKVSTEAF